MATDFRTTFLNFDTTTGQVQEEKATVVFNQPVNRFVAALQGYDLSYAGGEDHHLGQLLVELFSDRTPGTNNAVDVTVRFASGHCTAFVKLNVSAVQKFTESRYQP